MSSAFSRQPPPRKRLELAAEAFVEGADAAAITPVVHAAAAPVASSLDTPPEKEPEVASQTVRFTAREKAALQRLARAQRRSEHFILKDILSPALLAAAEKLDR